MGEGKAVLAKLWQPKKRQQRRQQKNLKRGVNIKIVKLLT